MTSLVDRSLDNLRRVIDASGGSWRPGQAEMVRAVATAIETRGRASIEAPTGTGKSIGALVPVITDGRPTLIVTSSIALQDQLEQIDIPRVAAVLNADLDYLAIKGRGQTVCPAKIASQGLFADPAIVKWSEDRTANRSRAACPIPVSDADWFGQYAVSEDECPGKRSCKYADQCPAEQAREKMATADIVIVNMHVFTMMLGAEIMGRFSNIIVDEAHDLLDAGCSAKAVTISARRISRIADGLYRNVSSTHPAINPLKELADVWEREVKRIGGNKPHVLTGGAGAHDVLNVLVNRAADALDFQMPRDTDPKVRMLGTRVNRLRGDLEAIRDTGSWACWVDARGLHASPLSLRTELAENAWFQRAVVLCSATLPSTIIRDTGLDVNIEPDLVIHARVESPFDLEANSMLYVCADLPDPSRERAQFEEAAMQRTIELVHASQGGALILCTSMSAVSRFTIGLRNAGFDVMAQGESDRARLVADFKDRRDSVLVATRSFFQGVDVPGEALRLVVIDRIPFPTPDDPLSNARRDAVKRGLVQAGKARSLDEAHWPAYMQIDVPNAATILTQAYGRLIRTESDQGVVVMLDNRLVMKQYGSRILAGMPVRPIIDRTRALERIRSYVPMKAAAA